MISAPKLFIVIAVLFLANFSLAYCPPDFDFRRPKSDVENLLSESKGNYEERLSKKIRPGDRRQLFLYMIQSLERRIKEDSPSGSFQIANVFGNKTSDAISKKNYLWALRVLLVEIKKTAIAPLIDRATLTTLAAKFVFLVPNGESFYLDNWTKDSQMRLYKILLSENPDRNGFVKALYSEWVDSSKYPYFSGTLKYLDFTDIWKKRIWEPVVGDVNIRFINRTWSRGTKILGISDVPVRADGGPLTPLRYLLHDLYHEMGDTYSKPKSPNGGYSFIADEFSKILTDVSDQIYKNEPRVSDAIEALLFVLKHESSVNDKVLIYFEDGLFSSSPREGPSLELNPETYAGEGMSGGPEKLKYIIGIAKKNFSDLSFEISDYDRAFQMVKDRLKEVNFRQRHESGTP